MDARDMGFIRSVTGLCALSVAAFYLFEAGDLTDEFKWICIAAILAFSFAWIVMGSQKTTPQVRRTPLEDAPTVESEEIELENELEIPQPITEGELDGATLRERKLAKIHAAESKREELLPHDLSNLARSITSVSFRDKAPPFPAQLIICDP